MLLDKLATYRIILASGSPRRKQLLKDLGLHFEIRIPQVEENYPKGLVKEKIATYLSQIKADSLQASEIRGNTLVIAADTIVCLEDRVLPKPANRREAISMLQQLSGKAHDVITGVSIRNEFKTISFYSDTRVVFKNLPQEEIEYYVDVFKPYDKAGAYGIQEWIGYSGILRIEGSYFNVMGLPVQLLYQKLEEFI